MITDLQIAIAMIFCDGIALFIVIKSVGGIKEFLTAFVDIRDTIIHWKEISKANIIK